MKNSKTYLKNVSIGVVATTMFWAQAAFAQTAAPQAPAAPAAPQLAPAPAPLQEVGDTWIYRGQNLLQKTAIPEWREVITKVNGDYINLRIEPLSGNAPPQELQVRADYNQFKNFQSKEYANVLYAWPLRVNTTWTYNYISQDGKTQYLNEGKGIVVGVEAIETPFGNINAYKVVHEIARKAANKLVNYSVDTYWYAPQFKTDILRDNKLVATDGKTVIGHSLVAMTSFTPGRK